jgi:hypothetical protein
VDDLTVPSHIGIVVPDLDTACVDLTATLGVSWAPVAEQRVVARAGDIVIDALVSLTWSREGPPHLELLHAAPGTPWAAEGTRVFHHLGYWTDDVRAAVERLEHAGLVVELSGVGPAGECPADFAYLTGGGLRVEVLDAGRKARLDRWFHAAPA